MKILSRVKLFYCIVFIGFVIRVLYISQIQSLWGDEAANFFHAMEPLSMLLKGDYSGFSTHPPLSFIIYKIWTEFGESEVWLRFLGVVISVVSIFVVSALARELFPKKKYISVVIAFLYAISTYQIRFGGELRYVNLLFLLQAISLYFFIRTINNKSSVVYFCIFGVLTLFTDYSFFWLWISMVCFALILLVKKLRGGAMHLPLLRVLICIAIPVLAFLPWLTKFLNTVNFSEFAGYISIPQFIDIPALLLSYLVAFPTRNGISADAYHFWKPIQNLVGNGHMAKLIYLILSNLLLVAALSKLLHLNTNKSLRFLTVTMLVPVILSFAVSQKNPIFVDYNLQIISVGLMIFLAAFICEHRKLGICILAVYLLLNALSIRLLFQFETVKENWPVVVSHIKNSLGDDNSLVLIYQNVHLFTIKYYYQRFNLNNRISLLDLDQNDIDKGVYKSQLLAKDYSKVCLVTYANVDSFARSLEEFVAPRYAKFSTLLTHGMYVRCYRERNYEKKT